MKRPKADASVRFRTKKGIGTVRGEVSETGLPAKTDTIQVQLALIAGSNASNAQPDWQDADRVGKLSKKGRAKFQARKFGSGTELAPGTSVVLWVRASTNFAVASTPTNRVSLELKE